MTTYEWQHKDKTWLHMNYNIRIKHGMTTTYRNDNIRIKHDYIVMTT